ncbi:hypothetical protein RhiirC2_795326 [Rhizophagus irregularis]|uniref:Uncharacterized protein n=1 Tax=Rhizophagus irregularis TaxID=588596 RepID=A0A2N1MBU3_9GLOM|nr:hypothetical protein RhiirC2_795326 [Rhizophagus irregularis]
MIKLAVAIFRFPSSNPYKSAAIQVLVLMMMDSVMQQLLLQLFGKVWVSLKKNASNFSLNLEFHQNSGVSSQADCEQNFFMLKWIIGNRRVRLDIKKLEVGNIISLNDEDDDITDNILLEERKEIEIQTCTNLVLEDFIDLLQIFDNIETVNLKNNDNVNKRNGNINFDPIT